MQVNLLFFGIIADLIGESSIKLEVDAGLNIGVLKEKLTIDFPQLKSYQTYAVAVNETYATEEVTLQENDTIAFIPPVSGG